MKMSNPESLIHWYECSSIEDVSRFNELNKLRIALNRKLVEITATATEYAKPISIYDMICIGGDHLKEMFISKWDSCFQVGFLTRSLSDNRYECLIFCGAITQKKQDWACKTTSQITHS